METARQKLSELKEGNYKNQLGEQAATIAKLSAFIVDHSTRLLSMGAELVDLKALAGEQAEELSRFQEGLDRHATVSSQVLNEHRNVSVELREVQLRIKETLAVAAQQSDSLADLSASSTDHQARLDEMSELGNHQEAAYGQYRLEIEKKVSEQLQHLQASTAAKLDAFASELASLKNDLTERLANLEERYLREFSGFQSVAGAVGSLNVEQLRNHSISQDSIGHLASTALSLKTLAEEHSRDLEIVKESVSHIGNHAGPSYAPVYLGKGILLVRTSRGLDLLCRADDIQITPHLIRNGIWEPRLTSLYEQCLKANMAYLEIGAHIGYFTTMATSLVGHGGRVHAFEPNPEPFRLLQLNLALQHHSYICTLAQLAVADAQGERSFYSFQYNMGSSTLASLPSKLLDEFNERPSASVVPCTSLDVHYAQSDIVFDFIKIDAEGAETLIFEGGAEFFQRRIHGSTVIYLECNPPALSGTGRTPESLCEIVRRYGFYIWKIREDGSLDRLRGAESLDPWRISDLVLSKSAVPPVERVSAEEAPAGPS